MLEGVKIVIERLQIDDSNKGRWLDIADGIIKDPQQIFTEQERNEVRNVYRTAMRKQFNANIIDELADKPKSRKAFGSPQIKAEGQNIGYGTLIDANNN
jgi:hypothetical protein